MSLILQQNIVPEGEIGIWHISETEEFFLEQLTLSQSEYAQYIDMKKKLQLEWLASRYLLHKVSGRPIRGKLLKDSYGKPYLENSLYHISLSLSLIHI